MSDPAWKVRAEALAAIGNTSQAYEILRDAAESGRTEALVHLAMMQYMNSEYAAADLTVSAAARLVDDDDFETHWQLHRAYTLGVGKLDTLKRWKLAFEHLQIAATLDNHPTLLLVVARHYEFGMNGVTQDLAEAEAWFSRAASAGSSEGASAYKRLLKRAGRTPVKFSRDA